MNSLKQLSFVLIHFVLLGIILFCIFQMDNKALETPFLAISIFLELSLLSYLNKK
jgi:hypothetical protein